MLLKRTELLKKVYPVHLLLLLMKNKKIRRVTERKEVKIRSLVQKLYRNEVKIRMMLRMMAQMLTKQCLYLRLILQWETCEVWRMEIERVFNHETMIWLC